MRVGTQRPPSDAWKKWEVTSGDRASNRLEPNSEMSPMTSQTRSPRRAAAALKTALPLVLKFCAGVAVYGALAVASAGMAGAHDALPTAAKPQGWSYPFSCCSGYDCREVNASVIGERPYGYVIAATGEVLSYSDSRVKNSPDGEYHWCSVAGKNDGRTICLFVPPKSF